MNYAEAKSKYKALQNPPYDADAAWYRQRGRDLEDIISALFNHEWFESRIRFRPSGEELDGSFFALQRHFLTELKWHSKTIEASVLYAFKGKVDGKLIGTIGIFISMSGYSKDAVNALVKGKELNIILFDKDDIDYAFDNSFLDLLKIKLRAAADEGNLYFRSSAIQIEKQDKAAATAPTIIQTISPSVKNTLCFICEGRTDQIILQELLSKAISYYLSKAKVRIIVAGGAANLINTAKSIQIDSSTSVFIIADADNQSIVDNIFKQNEDKYEILILTPDIETEWLGQSKKKVMDNIPDKSGSSYFLAISKIVGKIDIHELARHSESFRKILFELEKIEKYT